MKLITRSGQWQKEIPCALRETWLPAPAVCPPLAPMASLMVFGAPWQPRSSFLVPLPTTLWSWASWAATQTCPLSLRRLLASRCLLPWLGGDSLHPHFLPQRARGTDPVQVVEGMGVSQALRGVCRETGSLQAVASMSPHGGKPHPVWHCWSRAAGATAMQEERCCCLRSDHCPCALDPPGWALLGTGHEWGVHFGGLRLQGERARASDACLLSHPGLEHRGLVSLGWGCHI